MARKVRIEYAGALYHVMNRGDRRENIFRDNDDRLRFINTLGEACLKTEWQVHAYVLMPNHFHLVLETPQPNLVSGMKWLMGTYTGRFNRRHHLTGHVFAGRYKALLIDGDSPGYLRTVCTYVHLNPARARLVDCRAPLRTFFWSSWPDYLMSSTKRPPWLRVDRYLSECGIPRDTAAGRRHLENAIEDARIREGQDDYTPIRRGWCLGGEAFRKELLASATLCLGQEHYGPERQLSQIELAERIIGEELKRRRIPADQLVTMPKGHRQKIEIACRLRAETVLPVSWIANRLYLGSRTYATQLIWKSSVGNNKN